MLCRPFASEKAREELMRQKIGSGALFPFLALLRIFAAAAAAAAEEEKVRGDWIVAGHGGSQKQQHQCDALLLPFALTSYRFTSTNRALGTTASTRSQQQH
ncbi:hypothetical protein PR202_gb24717 [Eleusine coracana subsp. coracana]|uniref:Secreted protein n=1 Tax=Eleusine coracana subsp. coracana TaxID=191504 RepID=A0AAV5FM86_ELECO|nr:hypothetical protein PR202_gb24717 [Eleusine coracana subsp. coracana]